ncbi:MAG: hypothetical protein MZU95_07365 [Desulfomicrobium escambiense]|nr:hypothetical protein [Desulfomicrobium escambiense]
MPRRHRPQAVGALYYTLPMEDGRVEARFVTSWSTTTDEVETLLRGALASGRRLTPGRRPHGNRPRSVRYRGWPPTEGERFTSVAQRADGEVVVDTRVIALVVGVVGAAFGVAAVVADLPVLGLVAGGAALLAGITALLGGRTADGADRASELERQLVDRDTLLDATRDDLASAHERLAVLEAADMVPASSGPDGPAPDVSVLTDPTSQLFSEAYFRVALQSRLASARRHLRPVAVGRSVWPRAGRRQPGPRTCPGWPRPSVRRCARPTSPAGWTTARSR